jgi:hypothetical protein
MSGASNTASGGRERPPRPPLSDDRSWDIQDVAYFLNVSESTIRNLERSGQLPALPRIGKRVTFDPKVVRAFRDGWRPPPGWRRSPTPPVVIPIAEARRGE